MALRRFWRRLTALWRQARAPLAPRLDRAALANELLETLSPATLFSAGHLRYRRVQRRHVRYVRRREPLDHGRIDRV
jgi:hypothetical protein